MNPGPPNVELFFTGVLLATIANLAVPASIYAAPKEIIAIQRCLKGGWQIAKDISTLDDPSACTYLVQCRAKLRDPDLPPVTSNRQPQQRMNDSLTITWRTNGRRP